MKRPRPAPTCFADSDSDDDPPLGTPRFRPPTELTGSPSRTTTQSRDTQPMNAQPANEAQQDSLDIFMNSLQPSLSQPQVPITPIRAPSPQSPSTPPSTPAAQPNSPPSPGAAATAQELALPDFVSNPPPPVVFSPNTDWPLVDASELAIKGITLRAVGDSPRFLHTFDDAQPAIPDQLLTSLPPSVRSPTPIQAVAVPALCAGHNVLAVAPTGSGKTLAYGLPLLAHAKRQPVASRSERGPAAIVLAPTRELAEQIGSVLSDLCGASRGEVAVVVGGEDKLRQVRRLRAPNVHTVVATPGRLLDVLRMRAVRLVRVSFVVLDEADRMLDLGFGAQVGTVMSHIRPDAQRTLFSATMPPFVRRLADELLNKPVQITISTPSLATNENRLHGSAMASSQKGNGSQQKKQSSDRTQSAWKQRRGHGDSVPPPPPIVAAGVAETYLAFNNEVERHAWLQQFLPSLIRKGQVIVFCSTRGDAARVANALRTPSVPTACVHGETAHDDRIGLIKLFRSAELPVLVTTDVSARGLDIDNVGVVVNYACAKSWEWHVHRVGRTGRAGRSGFAYTLMCRESRADSAFAAEAAGVLRKTGATIPAPILELAAIERRAKEDVRGGRGGRGKRNGRGGFTQRDKISQPGRRRGG